jgi:hypothetical protein
MERAIRFASSHVNCRVGERAARGAEKVPWHKDLPFLFLAHFDGMLATSA